MSLNLIDLFKDQVGGQLAQHASKFLGESASTTESALGAAIPSLLGGLIDKAGDEKGAGAILDMIKGGGFDGSMLSNIGSIFGSGGDINGLMNGGGSLLSSILGNKLGGIVDIIAKVSGMKTGNSSSLLKMAAPMLMSVIGKKVLGDKLSPRGLMDMLLGQKQHVQKAAPAGLGSLMGFANWGKDVAGGAADKVTGAAKTVGTAAATGAKTVGNTAKAAGTAAVNTAADAGRAGKSLLSRLLPLLLLGLAIIFGIFTWRSCQDGKSLGDAVGDAAGSTTEMVKSGANKVGDAAKATGAAVADGAEAVGGAVKEGANAVKDMITSISIPGGAEIKAKAGGFTESIAKAFSGTVDATKSYVFDGVNFETGSSNITAESKTQIDNLTAIMKAYPNAVINIVGHTDNTGEAQNNLDLSIARAKAVKDALIAGGIDKARVQSQGRGQTEPIADNGTDEGRAQNRRVEVYIIKK